QNVPVAVRGDLDVEADETFTVTLANPGGGATLGRAGGTATIRNDDANKLSIGDSAVVEGNSGIAALKFTITLSDPAPQPISVEVNTADGTATAVGGDYTPITGLIVTFQPGGPLSQIVTVDVTGETRIEVDETLTLSLSNPSGPNVLIADGSGEGRVINDDI